MANLPPRLPSTATAGKTQSFLGMGSSAAISLLSIFLLSLLLCIEASNPSMAPQPSPQQGLGRGAPVPSFAFGWLDDKAAFRAGDTAVIMIKALDLPAGEEGVSAVRRSLSFSVSVNGKKGNSSYVADVAAHLGGDPATWNVTFVPMRAGEFVVLVGEERSGVGDSSLQFTVTAGGVHPSASPVSWMYYSRYVAGSKAFLSVVPKDAFGNDVARGTDMPGNEFFRVSGSYGNGSTVKFMDFQYNGWAEDGCLGLEFVPTIAGDFLVQVYGDNKTLRGSPLLLTVEPGPLDIAKSTCSWKRGTNILQIFSKLEIFIHQKDSFGNVVPETHPFDAGVAERASNLSVPVVDLLIEVVAHGIQLLSFNVVEPGQFVLTIFDAKLNQRVSNTVYMYDVFVGYCNGSNSFANGSGLAHSVASSMSSFMVYLEDQYHSPSSIENTMLQVQILSKNGTSFASPIISPMREPNGTISMGGPSSFDQGHADHQKIIAGNLTVEATQASHFNVSYTPQTAGEYEIWLLCGNIVLNSGNPYDMTVSPGAVNTSLSSVLMFNPRVKRSVENEVTVRLVDSFMNPVLSLESKLRLQLTSANVTTPMNMSSFVAGEFVNNKDGSYTAHYVAGHLGSYSMCIQLGDGHLAPCPFEVHVLADEYFSDVHNVSISVWEDESVSFDVLSNDYIAGGKQKLLFHLHHFMGQSYSITKDIGTHLLKGSLWVPGIAITYSDTAENISVTVKAQHGTVLLAPMPMKLLQPSDDALTIGRGGRAGKHLILQGTVEAINGALQLLQYIGNEDFYGSDVIVLRAMNRNGIEEAKVPIFVEPINDPPVILAPKSVFLGGKESWEGYQIFDKQRDPFEFSIVEPDLQSFPGNKSHLLLMLSLEVFEGTLVMTLPAGIVATAELKSEGDNRWQPLQTYVAIENHFVLRGAGIRFPGSVLDCNNAMQRLFLQGPSHDTTLTITVNDLGNYGCYPDCSEMMSTPLSTAKTVRLVKRKSTNSRIALLIGSAIVIEILTMLCLGGILLYFLLKCMIALKGKQRDCMVDEMDTPEQTPSHQHLSASPSDDAGHCSAPAAVLSLGGNRLRFRQRSSRSCKQELELQPFSGIREDENQDAQLAVDKDK